MITKPRGAPPRDLEADYDAAITHRAARTGKLLLGARDTVLKAYSQYETAKGDALTISPAAVDDETAGALRTNYLHTYNGKCLFSLREALFANVPLNLCLMCGTSRTADLDHFLPQEKYPEFSILPTNLVPICTSCNRLKANIVTSADGARFFHAYYDDVPSDWPLLVASIEISDTVVAVFAVNQKLTGQTLANARFQFEKLGLGMAYGKEAAVELCSRYDSFDEAYQDGGADQVADESMRLARSLRKNHGFHYWKAALFDGLAASKSFCGGGYRYIETAR